MLVTNVLPDFISYIDTDFRFAFANKAYEEQFGYSGKQIIGKKVEEITGPEVFQRSLPNLRKAMGGEEVRYESRLPATKSRAERFLEVQSIPDKSSDGSIKGIVVFGHDVTERKRIEEEAAEREQNFRFLADTMPQLVWTTKPDGDHDYYNKRWYEYTGLSEEESANTGWSTVLHPDDYDRAWKVWKESLATGKLYEIEYRFKKHDGTYQWFIGRAEPMRDEEGNIVRWFGTCTNIDDQKRREQQQDFLIEATQILGSSLDYHKTLNSLSMLAVPNMADWCAIDLVTNDGKGLERVSVAHVDPKKIEFAQELQRKFPVNMDAPTGTPAVIRTGEPQFIPLITEEMIEAATSNEEELAIIRQVGFTSMMIVPLEARDRVLGAVTFVSAESKRVFTQEDLEFAEELAVRAGIAVDNARLFAETAAAAHEVAVMNEQLEHRVAERTEQLVALNNELVRSNAELQDFAYVASHDLQEPLRKITAFSNLLLAGHEGLDNEGKEQLAIIQRAARRMSTLINDLLNYSRVTTNAQPFKSFSLDAALTEVLENLEMRINQSNGKVTTSHLGSITADPSQIRQLLQNIISNSLKYHKVGVPPEVRIEARREASQIIIEISDNGIGFDEAYLDKIFTIFQRLHGRDAYEGTGIGLAICKKIVERHGGTITAKSKVDEGSTFIISLPVKHVHKSKEESLR